jgi:hypothetical protein
MLAGQAQTNKQSDAAPDRMTLAERQAYWNSLKANPRVTNPPPTTRGANDKSPSFVGGGVTPLLVRSWVNGAIVTQAAYLDRGSSYDAVMPTIIGTDENDIALVYNPSGPGIYPKIELTRRKATDAPNTLGQGGGHVTVVSGAHSALDWGWYSACATLAELGDARHGLVWWSVYRLYDRSWLEHAPLQLPHRVATRLL